MKPSTLTLKMQALPFGMLYQDQKDISIRGYEVYPETWDYDPKTQISGLLRMGGKTEPTTVSTVSETTGAFAKDSDQANDDTGSD